MRLKSVAVSIYVIPGSIIDSVFVVVVFAVIWPDTGIRARRVRHVYPLDPGIGVYFWTRALVPTGVCWNSFTIVGGRVLRNVIFFESTGSWTKRAKVVSSH